MITLSLLPPGRVLSNHAGSFLFIRLVPPTIQAQFGRQTLHATTEEGIMMQQSSLYALCMQVF